MSNLKRIASNTVSQIAAKFITAALSVINIKLITGHIGTAGYGEYALIYDFLAIFLIIADFGFFTIAVKEIAADKEKTSSILGNILSLRLILMTVLSAAAIGLVYIGDYSAAIKTGVTIAAIGMSINLITITISAALQAHLKMNWNSLAIIIGRIAMLAYIIYTVKYIPNENALVHLIFSGLIGNTVMLAITAAATRSITKIRLNIDLKLWKELIQKTVIYGLSLIAATFYIRIITMMLGYHHGTEEVGIYQAPFRVFEILNLIPIVLLNCVLPVIMQRIKEPERLKEITQHTFDTLIIASFGIIVGIFAVAGPVINILFSQDFAASVPVLKILSIAALGNAIYVLFSYLLLAFKKEKALLVANIITLLTTIPIAFYLTKEYQEIGASYSLVYAMGAVAIFSYIIVKPQLNFSIINKATIASLAMAGLIYICEVKLGINTAIAATLGSITYLATLILNKGISPKIIHLILRRNIDQEENIEEGGIKIGLDARVIIGQKAGKGWYVYNVLKELGKLDKKNQYYLYARHDFYLPPNMPSNFHKRIISAPLPWWHFLVALDMRIILRIDTLFAPASYIIPSLFIGSRTNTIPVIHDLVSFKYKTHNKKARFIERITIGRTLQNAEQIIAVSECTKNDIINTFKIANDKITVIAEAARDTYMDNKKNEQIFNSESARILTKHNLPNNYLLFIGTLEPRKNIPTLIKAFKLYKEKVLNEQNSYTNEHNMNTKLVLIGNKGWNYKDIFQAITDNNLENDVITLGYIEDNELPYILSSARIFIYPSLYEGFGLPLLEAYACEVPVITSNTPALEEVARNCSILVDPQDPEELAEKIKMLLSVQKLRKDIIKKQSERLADYSWEKTAQEILKLLK